MTTTPLSRERETTYLALVAAGSLAACVIHLFGF